MPKKPGSGTATNNTAAFFNMKVAMRLDSLPDRPVKVLECFVGEGKLWDAVQKKFAHLITRTKIDINTYQDADNIIADSLRVIAKINLEPFDVIDLDSWGSCIGHLEILFNRGYKGIVHCTYCCPIPLNPDKILAQLYYTLPSEAIKQKPSLFAKKLPEMILHYLAKRGITTAKGLFSPKHNYFWFYLDK